ncbi:MAG TPA: dihydropteroate synthase [Candidatus Goldiibacteriota bacterium]|nr:dihydropteroate synthase [Candidatus Goldiibacteriota bacterium]HRQ44377.1 dihydropteroate synthase [Candidatus Goldiibacteriota bacterium]
MIIRGKSFDFSKVYLMGILNITPDSFSDGGSFYSTQKAVAHAEFMAANGADIIDMGAESTRPGAASVSAGEEISRVVPVIKEFRMLNNDIPVSIDTYKAATAAAAVEAGADIINDISGGTFDTDMLKTAAKLGVPYVIMHTNTTPDKMQKEIKYSQQGVVNDIIAFFKEQIGKAVKAGIKEDNIILDPGIGFGKEYRHNIEIINAIPEFKKLGFPVLTGASRKSFIGIATGKTADKRLFGSMAAAAVSVIKGADIIRAHDVPETADVIKMSFEFIKKDGGG